MPFGQVGGRRHVLQALLILDADRIAAELVRDAHGRDVHLALLENLIESQLGRCILAEGELHALGDQPVVHAVRLGVADRAHLGDQRRLAQPLLVDACGIQQLIVDDGVVHAHAALVEDAHDGLAMLELARQFCAQLRACCGQLALVERVTCERSCVILPSRATHPARSENRRR